MNKLERSRRRIDTKSHNEENLDQKMEEAIARMRKLDGILAEKVQREKQVKRETLIYQKLLQSDLIEPKQKESIPTDVNKNTVKFLALLPPPQQLEVLLERNEVSQPPQPPQPIFPTQIIEDTTKVKQDPPPLTRPRSSVESTSDNLDHETTQRSSSSKCRSMKQNEKQNFIKRNIELVKEAGSYVQMTEEEKQRLSELLHDLNEEAFSETEMKMVPTQQNGYSPDPIELKRLQEIDFNLQQISTSFVNSTTSSVQSFPTDYEPVSQKISRSELTEAAHPRERMENIEQRLQQLDQEWRGKYDVESPRLSDNQLQQLLNDAYYDMSCTPSHTNLSSRISDHSSVVGNINEDSELVSTNIKLPRDVLDSLLNEARSELGINDDDSTVSSEYSETNSVKSEDLG
uniref:fibrous sheath-interacting protein 1 isoform X2 n=1 Tax=Ciona intestinalis TaxID=7719 RepID=UPI000EF47429|nr:fibrous sheath-interacting protein 1 isoform X2 [Ciona intestinalis]|eukprot:XP_026692526.1 fibrous sheath-interacting protein 1 isoform X2 [Ciona intestinalis]